MNSHPAQVGCFCYALLYMKHRNMIQRKEKL
nr:MAG TPA: hypothetical protein [Bacteriophage sp.]